MAQANEKRGSRACQKVLSAKTIFVDNQTTDAELQHDAYLGMSKWGRYEIVDAPQKADLVLRLFGSSVVKFVPGGDPSTTHKAEAGQRKVHGSRRTRPARMHAAHADRAEERNHAVVRRKKDVQRPGKEQAPRGAARSRRPARENP